MAGIPEVSLPFTTPLSAGSYFCSLSFMITTCFPLWFCRCGRLGAAGCECALTPWLLRLDVTPARRVRVAAPACVAAAAVRLSRAPRPRFASAFHLPGTRRCFPGGTAVRMRVRSRVPGTCAARRAGAWGGAAEAGRSSPVFLAGAKRLRNEAEMMSTLTFPSPVTVPGTRHSALSDFRTVAIGVFRFESALPYG